jgi:hypothetical protein
MVQTNSKFQLMMRKYGVVKQKGANVQVTKSTDRSSTNK